MAAQLKLCEIYKRTNRKSERNRLLDALAARFPDDKKVLFQAGRGCIERKAYQKGIQYLDRAVQLDRIDLSIKDAIVEARQRQARQLYREKRLEKARKLLKENEPLLVEDPAQFARSQ